LAINLLSLIIVISFLWLSDPGFSDLMAGFTAGLSLLALLASGFLYFLKGLPAASRFSISINYQGAKVQLFGDIMI
jgi:hypothetical protein